MPYRHLPIVAVAAMSLATLSACTGVVGNGEEKAAIRNAKSESRSFAVKDFTGVSLQGSDDVKIVEGAAFSLIAKGPADVIDDLRLEMRGDTLEIGRKDRKGWSWGHDDPLDITITMPVLAKASIDGSGDMNVARAKSAKVEALIAGSGDLTIARVEAETLALSIAGSGDLKVDGGSVKSGHYSVAGSGAINATGVSLADADIVVAGSGDIAATVTGDAKVSAVGSGDISVGGGARCETSKMGSGDVKCG
jgi:hypothetical protein